MFRNLVRLISGFFIVAIPLVLLFLGMMLRLATTSVASIWVGVPKAVNRISDEWAREGVAKGLPITYSPVVRGGAKVVATITLILGWLVLASLTIFIIRLILR